MRSLQRCLLKTFVKGVLVDQLHASTVIVGKNFTYGHKAAGNVDSLIKSGTDA